MLKFIFVLGFLGAFEYDVCCLETQTEDWRKQGFYRPQRSYSSQNDNSYQASQNQYSISQNSFRSNGQSSGSNNQNAVNQNSSGNNRNSQTQSNFGSYNQPQASFGFSNQKKESPRSEIPFGAYQNAQSNVFGSKTRNSQQETQGTFGSRFGQNTFASSFNQNPGFNNGQNSFTNSQSQYTQKQSFESSFQGTQNYFRNSSLNSFGHQNQNTFPLQNATSSFSNFGSNSFTKNQYFKAPDYLPPARFKAPEYLPPDPRTTIPPHISKTTTRRPFYTTTTRQPITTTKRPFFTTTTTRLNFFTTTTTKRPLRPPPVFLPAQAMKVPPEPEDDGDEIIPVTSTTPSTTTTTTPTTTTRKSPSPAPALAMKVPPETEDDDTEPDYRNTTAQVAPARAMNVPPEPEDDGDEIIPVTRTTTSTTPSTTTTHTSTTSTTTTTPSTTTSTTPSTTTTTTPSTITTTTPSTTTSTTPPTTTTTTTPSTTTTAPSTTTTIKPPTTTTTTTPSTTTTTSTTPPTTTTTTTPSTTTTTTPSIATTNTTPDPNRNLIQDDPTIPPTVTTSNTSTTTTTCTTITTCTTTYKAPECLPPKDTEPLPPAPAIAIPVPPEPEYDPLDPKILVPLNIEIRAFDPCQPEPTTTTIKPTLRGPLYLPPDPKVRVERSSNITLKLEDLDGLYRPVWYAGIYRKTTDPYLPICGGSIIREDVVISAAHCFWDDAVGKQPAVLFAVAARKLYKPWKETMDKKAQKSDILDIIIPPRFLGAKTSFQEDLAILKLATPFTYNRGLRPICVDFDDDFDRQQMKAGHLGTIAGWGYTDAVGTPTQRLLWLELPYVEIEKCIQDSEDSFLKYITCDKVCAGENDTGKALCRGDSGGGLAFWSGSTRHATPYLRGVASTAPSRRNAECNVYAYASFTHLRAHRTFLRDHVPDIETCRFWE